MKCKACGAELEKGAKICPGCGAKVEKKKLSRGATIAISAALVIVVAAVFVILVVMNSRSSGGDEQMQNSGASATGQTDASTGDTGSTPADPDPSGSDSSSIYVPREGSYTVPSGSVTDEQLRAVVASYGETELTNEQLAYYYWYGIRTFLTTYADYIGNFLDVSAPLDTQYYDNDQQITWQSYFLDQAFSSFEYYAAMLQAAEEANFTLPSAYESYLANMGDSMAESVTEYGYTDVESYLRACFGPYATLDGYREFTRTYLTALCYVAELQSSLVFSEDEVEAYFQENAESFSSAGISQDGTRLVNVRHILIQPDDSSSESDWAEAEEKATDIYNTWKNNPSEDYFAQLAQNYSADGGSNSNGGLYEQVYPGEMVEAFDSWCFDQTHETGDSGIVKTDYGYHIMYFVSYDVEYWYYCANNALANSTYTAMEEEIMARHELVTDYDAVILVDPDGMYQ